MRRHHGRAARAILGPSSRFPYLADHLFIYCYALGACGTAVVVIFSVGLDWHIAGALVELPKWLRLLLALIYGLGGLFTARGVRTRNAPSEAGGLMLLGACSLVIAIGRVSRSDPVAFVAVAITIGLLARAVLVTVVSRAQHDGKATK